MVRAVTPIPFVKARFFDRCGKPLAGGKVYTYEANTTTPKVTYKDPYGLTPNTNPIILDAAGEADIYLDGTYRIRITDRNDVLINDVAKIGSWFSDNLQDTLDNISGAMDDALKPILQNLDDAINAAAAAGAGANGWTDLLIKLANGRTQADKNADFITTKDFGCVGDGVTDDSQNLTKAIKFAYENKRTLDGLGLTYACHGVTFDSNLTFKNANLVCNKFDADLVSVLDSGAQDVWLENVYFENIKINGKRELHTGINQSAITGEDGGRHGFRLGRKMRNIRFINCEGNNCATDGIMLHPWTGAGNNRIVDVQLIDCKFNGNRRHGGSSDSSNKLKLIRVQANGNGGDINPNADINSGLRGQLFNNKLYGNGWDAEDYDFNDISNILFEDCEMLGNVKSGLLIMTPGNTNVSAERAIITINGGSYDKGINNIDGNASIIVTTSLDASVVKTFELLKFDNVNLNGGDITYRQANANVYNCIDVGYLNSLQNTVTSTDLPKNKQTLATGSVIYTDFKNENGDISYANGTLTIAPITKTTNQYYDASYVDIGIVSGSKLGGIKFKLGIEGMTETSFTDFNHNEYLTVTRSKILPLRGGYNLGDATHQFDGIYLTTAPTVSSDERIKKDIRTLNDAEKLVAKDLKAEICMYRLKDNDDKLQIGVIAQKVVSIFDKHGLNARDYQVVHYDSDIDRYSIVYEQLILFILLII